MSYSIDIYSRRRPSKKSIRAFVADFPDIGVEFSGRCLATIYTGDKHVESHFLLSCDGPFKVEPSEVHRRIGKTFSGLKWVLTLSAGGNVNDRVLSVVVRFAEYLAVSFQGVVFDCQQEKIIFPTTTPQRANGVSSKSSRIRLLRIMWALPLTPDLHNVGETFLRVMTQVCEIGLPRRYGTTEPFQCRYSDAKRRKFLAAIESALKSSRISYLFWDCIRPCFGGHISCSRSGAGISGGLERIMLSVSFDGEVVIHDAEQCETMKQLLTVMAVSLGAFFGAAYVLDNVIGGRQPRFDSMTERSPFPKADVWLGIPDTPMWTTWYGKEYVPYVEETFKDYVVEEHEEGLLVSLGEQPLGAIQLKGIAPQLPKKLLVRYESPPSDVSDMSELINAGFKEFSNGPNGLIVLPKPISAEIIPGISPQPL